MACDEVGLPNTAERASGAVPQGDCTVIEHFFNSGIHLPFAREDYKNKGDITGCMTFGFIYVKKYASYYCTNYNDYDCGTKTGQTNTHEDFRKVCTCGEGNISCCTL